jgi:hypothetical protein
VIAGDTAIDEVKFRIDPFDVTATRLPAGEYRIRVVALQGANLCWLHDQPHRIRAAGLGRSEVLPMMKTCN